MRRRNASRQHLPLLALAALLLTATGSAAQEQQGSEAAFELPPLEGFRAIVERPLFARDRRPAAVGDIDAHAADPGEGATEAAAQILLAGTAIDQFNRTVAILHDSSRGIDFRVIGTPQA